jgi:hypothetical protein
VSTKRKGQKRQRDGIFFILGHHDCSRSLFENMNDGCFGSKNNADKSSRFQILLIPSMCDKFCNCTIGLTPTLEMSALDSMV